jgi:hypothetical protein
MRQKEPKPVSSTTAGASTNGNSITLEEQICFRTPTTPFFDKIGTTGA